MTVACPKCDNPLNVHNDKLAMEPYQDNLTLECSNCPYLFRAWSEHLEVAWQEAYHDIKEEKFERYWPQSKKIYFIHEYDDDKE